MNKTELADAIAARRSAVYRLYRQHKKEVEVQPVERTPLATGNVASLVSRAEL